jgi:hypothetical protein
VSELPEPIPADDPERTRSPRRGMAAAILSLQAIVLALTTPVMISIEHVSWQVAVPVGCGLAVICILLAGMLRRPWAYAAGWAVQVASVALGFVIGMMFVLGVIFLALWWGAMALARKIERERAAAYAEYDRLAAGHEPLR